MSRSTSTVVLPEGSPFADEDLDNLLVLSEQSPQAQSAKDINQTINALTADVAQFATAFGLSREIINQSIDDLRRQGAHAQTQLDSVSDRHARQIHVAQQGIVVLSKKQIKTDQSLEALKIDAQNKHQGVQETLLQHDGYFNAVQTDLARCDEEYRQARDAMAAQEQRLLALHEHLQTLEALEHALQEQLEQQNLTQQQESKQLGQAIQANKLLIEGLQALYQQQQQALDASHHQHTALCERVDGLQQGLTQLEGQSLAYQRFNNRRFWRSSAVWSTALLACFALLATGYYYANASWQANQIEMAHVSEVQGDQQARLSGIDRGVDNIHQQLAEYALATQTLDEQVDDLRYVLQGPGISGAGASQPVLPLLSTEQLGALNGSSYSLQLLTVNRWQDVVNFMNQRQGALAGKTLFYAPTQHKGGTRFSLFMGVYEHYTDAQASLNALPLRLSSNAPWIRTVGSIQASMVQ